jgi:hypothetical protein
MFGPLASMRLVLRTAIQEDVGVVICQSPSGMAFPVMLVVSFSVTFEMIIGGRCYCFSTGRVAEDRPWLEEILLILPIPLALEATLLFAFTVAIPAIVLFLAGLMVRRRFPLTLSV